MCNGPNPRFKPLSYTYPFDGDGMIHALALALALCGGRAHYRNRYVRTRAFRAEERVGRAIYGGVMQLRPVDPALLRPSDDPGPFKNGAFIDVLAHGGHLLALSEADTAYEMTMDLDTPRGLDRGLVTQLATGQWIREGLNCLVLGPTGVGKTWLACALAQQACRQGFTTRYLRAPRLFEELRLAHADGGFPKLMRSFAKTDLLLIDDWGLIGLDAEARRDLLELLDDRHGQRATLITSQLPLEHWHDLIGDPTLADAILDRLVHNAYRITLKGESMRKRRARTLTPSAPAA